MSTRSLTQDEAMRALVTQTRKHLVLSISFEE
jgi:hypothetical protein